MAKGKRLTGPDRDAPQVYAAQRSNHVLDVVFFTHGHPARTDDNIRQCGGLLHCLRDGIHPVRHYAQVDYFKTPSPQQTQQGIAI